jgi:hypothetical protein
VEKVPPSLDATASWVVAHDRCIEPERKAEDRHQEPRPTGSGGCGVDLRRHGGAHLQLLLAPDGEG